MQIEKTAARGPHKIRTGIAKIIALAILPLRWRAVNTDQPTQVAGWTLIDPAQRHPILVSRQPENLALNVGRGSQGLTPMQRARVMEFVSNSKSGDAGNSRFVISAPAARRTRAPRGMLPTRCISCCSTAATRSLQLRLVLTRPAAETRHCASHTVATWPRRRTAARIGRRTSPRIMKTLRIPISAARCSGILL